MLEISRERSENDTRVSCVPDPDNLVRVSGMTSDLHCLDLVSVCEAISSAGYINTHLRSGAT